MKNVLILSTIDPRTTETGGDVRINNIREGLSKQHNTKTITFVEDYDLFAETSEIVPVRNPSISPIKLFDVKYLQKLRAELSSETWDVVYVSNVNAALYGIYASYVSDSYVIFDDMDVTYQLKRDQEKYFQSMIFYLLERILCKRADLVIPVSEIDREKLSKWSGDDSMVVANGYDHEKYNPEGESLEFGSPVVLFFGNLRYQPNVEAVEHIAETIAPRLNESCPEAEIHVVGPDPENVRELVAESPNVVLNGYVERIDQYIRGSEVVIVPLDTGSGTRFKIIESLACGVPVVSTAKGAEGWPFEWPNLTISAIDDFPADIERVLEDGRFDEELFNVMEKYSWDGQVSKITDHIDSL